MKKDQVSSPQILAAFDDEGVFVYQAFKPSIVEHALLEGRFGAGFNLERMTWIKPSFGWMLYRSGYATKRRQERILKIKICHEGFWEILRHGVSTTYEPHLYASNFAWKTELNRSECRFQWDPERDLFLHKLEARALQLGIRGSLVRRYVHDWTLSLEDVTPLAHAIRDAVQTKEPLPKVPRETVYEVDEILQHRLGIGKSKTRSL